MQTQGKSNLITPHEAGQALLILKNTAIIILIECLELGVSDYLKAVLLP